MRTFDFTSRTAIVTGAASMLGGEELRRQAPGGAVPIEQGNVPSARTPYRAAKVQRFLGAMGPLNIALTAGVIGITTVLAMKAGKSQKWGFVARFLP